MTIAGGSMFLRICRRGRTLALATCLASICSEMLSAGPSALENILLAEAFPPHLLGAVSRLVESLGPDSSRESLTFVSGESEAAEGQVVNRVRFGRDGAVDVWSMLQCYGQCVNLPESKWFRVVIAVDRTSAPFQAYFAELAPMAKQIITTPVSFQKPKVACLGCHVNGPRLLRPRKSPVTDQWTASDFEKLSRWNQIVSGYGWVKNWGPRFWESDTLLPQGPHFKEPLNVPQCVSCHGSVGKARGPLLRAHGPSIMYLLGHRQDSYGFMQPAGQWEGAAMPPGGMMLSQEEQRKLERWLNQSDGVATLGPG